MRLSSETLAQQLAQQLAPAYLVSGDEPLLVQEAVDAIRGRARATGFSERAVFFIERSQSVWDEALQAARSLSLFAERRILEIRLPGGKPGTAGARALAALLAAAGDSLLLLIVTGRLDREAQAAEWVRAVQARGAWVAVWPVERGRLPQWLRARLQAAGLSADPAALALLAERSEGNLLAAQQEIDKLALLLPRGARVGVEEVIACSADSARFDVFRLEEALRARDAARALRILGSLRAEGTEPTLVLWAVVRALREWAQGQPQAAPRQRPSSLRPLLARAGRADRVAKGLAAGDAWDELAWLTAELCGIGGVPPLLEVS
jgi:DNA polymerase III subunit delta